MQKGVVIAVDLDRSVFAVKAADGRCAVFCQSGGIKPEQGDLVSGEVLGRGSRALRHRNGTCWAVGDTGPIEMNSALQLVKGRTAAAAERGRTQRTF